MAACCLKVPWFYEFLDLHECGFEVVYWRLGLSGWMGFGKADLMGCGLDVNTGDNWCILVHNTANGS